MAFWHWWVLGFALLALETLTPGAFCMWVGFAAIATGLIVWPLSALDVAWQILLFAVLSLISVGLWFRYRPLSQPQTSEPALNRRGIAYVGRELTLTQPIVDGIGQARVDDTVWRVGGPTLPSGSRVRVVAVDGAMLRVEAAD